MPFVYPWVGPEKLRLSLVGTPVGAPISDETSLSAWLGQNPDALGEGATFIVGLDGVLRLAPRRSEHLACAGANEVLAAGELRFARGAGVVKVVEASNQSMGFCPDIECWSSVASALAFRGVALPKGWTHEITVRRCPACTELNLVKERWFVCVFCDAELPLQWNVSARRLNPTPAGCSD